MNRRAFLGAMAGGTGAVAGCPGGRSAPTPTPGDTRTGSDDDGCHERVPFEDVDREVYVEAERYRFIPGTNRPVRVRTGERVGLALTAPDDGYHSGHGLRIPAFDVDLQALPGVVTSTTFLARPARRYEMRCDVYRGSGHEEMHGTLVVRR